MIREYHLNVKRVAARQGVNIAAQAHYAISKVALLLRDKAVRLARRGVLGDFDANDALAVEQQEVGRFRGLKGIPLQIRATLEKAL